MALSRPMTAAPMFLCMSTSRGRRHEDTGRRPIGSARHRRWPRQASDLVPNAAPSNLGAPGPLNPRARPSDEGALEPLMRSQPGPLFWLAFSPARPGGWADVASQAVCLIWMTVSIVFRAALGRNSEAYQGLILE